MLQTVADRVMYAKGLDVRTTDDATLTISGISAKPSPLFTRPPIQMRWSDEMELGSNRPSCAYVLS
jgi:hypothetical protein